MMASWSQTFSVLAIVWLAATAMSAWAVEIEYLDFHLHDVLAPGSPLLRPGMHVHECGDTALDIYVTERVPLAGGITVATRRATLRAFRTLTAYAYGSVGSREQEVVTARRATAGEAVGMSVRHRVKAAGVVSGLRPAARVLERESLLMVFVLPLSGPAPTADCAPENESVPQSESHSSGTGDSHEEKRE